MTFPPARSSPSSAGPSILAGFVSIGLQAPWNTWIADEPATPTDILVTVLWGVQLGPAIYDAAFGFATGSLAKFLAAFGPILDSCCGFVIVGVGIAAGVLEAVGPDGRYTGYDVANSIVPPLGRPFRMLILDQDNVTTPAAMGGLMAIEYHRFGRLCLNRVLCDR